MGRGRKKDEKNQTAGRRLMLARKTLGYTQATLLEWPRWEKNVEIFDVSTIGSWENQGVPESKIAKVADCFNVKQCFLTDPNITEEEFQDNILSGFGNPIKTPSSHVKKIIEDSELLAFNQKSSEITKGHLIYGFLTSGDRTLQELKSAVIEGKSFNIEKAKETLQHILKPEINSYKSPQKKRGYLTVLSQSQLLAEENKNHEVEDYHLLHMLLENIDDNLEYIFKHIDVDIKKLKKLVDRFIDDDLDKTRPIIKKFH